MLTGAAVALLMFVILLAVPLSLSYQLSYRQAVTGSIDVHWLFGLVRIHLPVSQATTRAKPVKQTDRKRPAKKSTARKSNPVAALRQKPFRRRVIRFIRDVWHAIHKHDLMLRIRVGLGDPADTGQLWAIAGPVSAVLAGLQDISITLEPEFIDSVFELDSSGSIRIIPLQLLYLVIALLLSPPLWRGLIQMRKAQT